MNLIKTIFALFLLISISCEINAQDKESSQSGNSPFQLQKDTLNIKGKYPSIKYTLDTDFPKYVNPDTTLNNYHFYNLVEFPLHEFRWAGNLGQYHFPLKFQLQPELDFNWGFRNLDRYKFNNKNKAHFFTGTPFTELKYIWGQFNEQGFNALHTQNIKDKLNLTANYRVISSDGLYLNQKTSLQNLNIGTWYKSESGAYQNWVDFTWNKDKLEQNGGISSSITDPVLWAVSSVVKTQVPVNITGRNDNNGRSFSLRQSLSTGFKYEEVVIDTIKVSFIDSTKLDSIQIDSSRVLADSLTLIQNPFDRSNDILPTIDTIRIDTSIKLRMVPVWTLVHGITYDQERFTYTDAEASDSFYPNTYIESRNGTIDSLRKRVLTNEVAILSNGRNPFKKDSSDLGFRGKVALKNEFVSLKSIITFDTDGKFIKNENFQNTWLDFRFFKPEKPDVKLNYDFKLQFGLWGYQTASLILDGMASYKTRFGKLSASYNSSIVEPDYLMKKIFTNHFQWDQDLKKIKSNHLKIFYEHPKDWLSGSFSQYIIDDLVLFNQDQESIQLDQVVSIQQFRIKSHLKWRNWHLENLVDLQYSSNDLVPLSNLMYTGSLWVESLAFKKSMKYQFGLLISYNSNYSIPALAPSIGQFYYQDNNKGGFYPVMDLFLNAKIATVRIFIRTQNLNQGLFGQGFRDGYYAAQGLPMMDRAVKIGISWQFYD